MSCHRSQTDEVSLVFRNRGTRDIERVVVVFGKGEEGIRLLNVASGSLKSWHPLGVDLDGRLVVRIWWSDSEGMEGVLLLTEKDQKTIARYENLILTYEKEKVTVECGNTQVTTFPIGQIELNGI